MGRRSDFERIERDCYDTPPAAVTPLLPHLPKVFTFAEPCAGYGALVDEITSRTEGICLYQGDEAPRDKRITWGDALQWKAPSSVNLIITNPPWDRKLMHPMIEHFSAMRPTWLLFDADWMHTRQSAPFMPWLRKVVSVGRVKWIPDSKMTGKDNCAWHLFDQKAEGQCQFYGRAA